MAHDMMQLSFFPRALPDEPLYSLAARYQDALNYGAHSDTVGDLLGGRFISAVVDLPSRLGVLAARMPWAFWTADALVTHHTAAPYYEFFAEEAQRRRLREALVGEPPPSAAAVLGTMAACIRSPRYLRYCQACVRDDRADYAAAYWHRTHQLPGVVVCPRHRLRLTDSGVERRGRRTRHAYVSLEAATGKGLGGEESPAPFSGVCVAIARDCAELVSGDEPPPDIVRLRAALQGRFRLLGWATGGGNLRARTIRAAWAEQYPREVRTALHCGIEELTDPIVFVRSLLFGGRRGVHPLLAVLILRLVGWSVERLRSETRAPPSRASGQEQIPTCINPVCPDSGTSRWMTRERTGDDGSPAVFRCERCGLQYRPSVAPGAPPKILERGELWDTTLTALITDGAHSQREIGRRLQADPLTIKRHAMRLGIRTPWKAPFPGTSHRDVDPLTREQNRSLWCALRVELPSATRTQLRRGSPALWTWLYRNDRKWLADNQPPRCRRNAARPRVDWADRDRQLRLQLISCAQDILDCPGRPIRITRAELARRLKRPELFRPDIIRHLPETDELTRGLVESRRVFALRRIQWCADEFIREGKVPERWELIRRAGLRPDIASGCAFAIGRELDRIRAHSSRACS